MMLLCRQATCWLKTDPSIIEIIDYFFTHLSLLFSYFFFTADQATL